MAGVKLSDLPEAEGTTGTERVLVVQDGVTKTLPLELVEGPQGDPGNTGLSAYQVALSVGFEGDENAWLETLVGPQGDQGDAGPSAFEMAVTLGFEGTIEEWLANPLAIETALQAIAAGGNIYVSKAALDAAASGIDEGGFALVLVDEDEANHSTVYRKVTGAMTLVLDLTSGAPPAWGDITGTLSDQTDLQAALSGFLSASAIGVDVQAFDVNLPAFPAGISGAEIGYLDGVTSGIQAQINGKAATSHSHDAADISSGTIDPARLPAAVFAAPVLSSGGIANLDSGQQAAILGGSTVITTDGRHWIYKGSGSKTAEASYQEMADVTPDWGVLANKPGNVTAIAGLTSAANKLPYFTGSNAAALADLTAAGRAVIGAADASAQRTALGLVIGTNVAAASHSHDASAITSGTIDPARLPAAVFAAPILSSGGIANLDSGQQAAVLGGSIVITTDGRHWIYKGSGSKTAEASYQEMADVTPEWSVIANKPGNVTAIASLTSAANKLPYFTGSNAAALTDLTSTGRAIIGASDQAAARAATGIPTLPAGAFVGDTDTQTLTNKRVRPRVGTNSGSGAKTPSADNDDANVFTGLSGAVTINAPSGTPTQMQDLVLRLKDNGTSRALTWNAIYRAMSGVTLPAATVAGKTMYIGMFYNSTDSKWDVQGVNVEP